MYYNIDIDLYKEQVLKNFQEGIVTFHLDKLKTTQEIRHLIELYILKLKKIKSELKYIYSYEIGAYTCTWKI